MPDVESALTALEQLHSGGHTCVATNGAFSASLHYGPNVINVLDRTSSGGEPCPTAVLVGKLRNALDAQSRALG